MTADRVNLTSEGSSTIVDVIVIVDGTEAVKDDADEDDDEDEDDDVDVDGVIHTVR